MCVWKGGDDGVGKLRSDFSLAGISFPAHFHPLFLCLFIFLAPRLAI